MLPVPHYHPGTYPPSSFYPGFGPPGVVPPQFKQDVEGHLQTMLQRKKATRDILRARAAEQLPQHEDEFHDLPEQEIPHDLPPLEEVPAEMPPYHRRDDGGDNAEQVRVPAQGGTPVSQRLGQGAGVVTRLASSALAHTLRFGFGAAQGVMYGGPPGRQWESWPVDDTSPPPGDYPPGHPGAPVPPQLAQRRAEIPPEAPPPAPQHFSIASDTEEERPRRPPQLPVAISDEEERPVRNSGRSGTRGGASGSSMRSGRSGRATGILGGSGSSGSSSSRGPYPWPAVNH